MIIKRVIWILKSSLLLPLLAGVGLSQDTKQVNNASPLELKKPIERTIKSGEIHSYSVSINLGQVLDVVVEQRGVDVVVEVMAPDGSKVIEVDSPNGSEGPEVVLLKTAHSGTYILQVRPLENGASGRYVVTLNDRRTPTEKDLKHFEDLAKLAEAQRIENQWVPLYNQGRYAECVPLAERVLAIRESVLGRSHSDVARTLNTLAVLYQNVSNYSRAESLFRRSLAIEENIFGKDHPNLAIAYGNFATLYFEIGDYEQAEALLKKALVLREKAFGLVHPDVALTLHNLTRVYEAKGSPVEAEVACLRALEIYKKTRPADHPDIARSLGALAELYRARGDFAHAEPLYQQALAIYQKWGTRGEFWAANVMADYATMNMEVSNYSEAERLFKAALTTYEKTIGPEHNDTAQVLNNLAEVYTSTRRYDAAKELHERALAIRKKLFGPNSLQYAESVSNLGHMYWLKRDFELARGLIEQAVVIWESRLGKNHPYVASGYGNLAIQQSETGDIAGSIKSLKRVIEVEEHNLKLILTTGSEDQKQIYLNKHSGHAEYTVWLNVNHAKDDEGATSLAFDAILQRKGRALDAMSDQIGNLRRRASPEDRALLDRLRQVRAQLSRLQLSVGRGLQAEEISRLELENENIEAKISRHSDEFRAQFANINVEAVRRALPAGTALVEFVVFRAFQLHERGVVGEQYAAYVLRPESPMPQFVDLGNASEIDDLVQQWRIALSDPRRSDVKALGRSVDQKVMRLIRRLLGSVRHLFVSPDGALNLIPFAALVDENDRYLVERYAITYLTSGRDLLRLQSPQKTESTNVLVLANPLFDLTSVDRGDSKASSNATSSTVQNRRSFDFTSLDYKPLAGTAAEAQALNQLWPSATVLSDERATEAALKQAKPARILHVATHGFFLRDRPRTEVSMGQPDSVVSRSLTRHSNQENPLLRSGLVLAGVKQQLSGTGEDGVLTALEMAGLDLWETKLVVLSACETGLGDVKRGEGVYGLRRALVLAGSESQVISLWKVSDAGTRDLMTAYYTRIQNLKGRTEALREVQLAMLQGKLAASAGQSSKRETKDVVQTISPKDYKHPYYWAAFIQSGDWRNMDGN
jgi:CHAT domain-containing protein/tetratricopeptide (TPR) repeat protein